MNVMDMVMSQLGSGGLSSIAGTLGLDEGGAKNAVGTAVTVLTGALAHNASEPKGAQALDTALARDHDGSIFDNLGGFIGSFTEGPGAGILKHVLGGAQPQVQQAVAEKSGLSLEKVMPLLVIVAPLVMGALGKMKREKQLDASAVAGTLAAEKAEAEKQDPGLLGNVIGMLGGLAGGGGGGGGATSSPSGGLGGILGSLGGLFGKKKQGS